jgi:hypothetical protein
MKKKLTWTDEIYDIYSEVSTELALYITNDEKSQDKGTSGDSHMVDVVERAFRDLERLGLEGEVSNASTVCSIEEKLPLSERLL